MENSCSFHLRAPVSRTVFKTKDNGKSFWQLYVRLEKGELCFYVHDPELQKITEALELGAMIEIQGIIEPHKTYSQTERPHFLSPATIKVST